MSAAASQFAPHSGAASRFEANIATRDSALVKYAVLAAGLTFFALFLLLPCCR